MRQRHQTLRLAATILLLEGACLGETFPDQPPRGVRAKVQEHQEPLETFDRTTSAGLFVGIRNFAAGQGFTEVPFAVDDAIDLAYLFALNYNTRLIEPGRVKLALSGEPQKPVSRQRLNALLAAGASRHSASHVAILRLLEEQVQAAGAGGVLIVTFATHGFSDEEGAHYLALEDSLLRHPETSLKTSKALAMISQSSAVRRLAFLDACRERLTNATRTSSADLRSAAPLLLAGGLAHAKGQVVFFAAPHGGYAYDDYKRQNGVFSATVLEGLRCAAETNARGFVTADTLTTFVNEKVTQWLRQNVRSTMKDGIQVNLEGPAKDLPLAACLQAIPPTSQPALVRKMENFFNVISVEGIRLWGETVSGRISHAKVADLNADGKNEVVVGVDGGGEDTGKILVFGNDGTLLWSADTAAEFNYDGGHSGRLGVTGFAVGDLFHQGRLQIVALSRDAQSWYQSRLTIWEGDGTLLSSYWHPGHLTELLIAARTPDHPQRIIVSGINNDLRGFFQEKDGISVLFMLDPRNVRGEALPFTGRSEQGPHLWYGAFIPGDQYVIRLETVDYDRDGAQDISVWTSTGHAYYFDFDGRIIGRGSGDSAQGESGFGHLVVTEPEEP